MAGGPLSAETCRRGLQLFLVLIYIYIYPFPFFIPYCMAFPLNLEVFVFAKMQAMLFDSPIGGIAWA